MDFWVQRVAKVQGRRVLINPTALIGVCEIDKIAKFLLTLTNKKCSENPSSSPFSKDRALLIVDKQTDIIWFPMDIGVSAPPVSLSLRLL